MTDFYIAMSVAACGFIMIGAAGGYIAAACFSESIKEASRHG